MPTGYKLNPNIQMKTEDGILYISLAIYQLVVDIYKFPKRFHSGLLMALA